MFPALVRSQKGFVALTTLAMQVLTTLLEGGFTVDDIGEARAGQFALFLRKSLDEQNGRMGFGIRHSMYETQKGNF